MKISVAIMATFERREHAQNLRDELMTYPFVDPYIVYDEGVLDSPLEREWETGKRALMRGIGKSDWHVVLQDDAIIGDSFYENLESALSSVPERSLVSLYLGTVRPYASQVKTAFDRAYLSGYSWISASTLLWGVGIAIPTDDIEKVLENAQFCPKLVYDRRVGNYYLRKRKRVYYTTMSLVQHNFQLGSLIGNDRSSQHRVCHYFVNDKCIEYNSRFVAL